MRVISYFRKKDISPKKFARRSYDEEKKRKIPLFTLIFFLLIIIFFGWLLIFSPYCKIKLISQIEDYESVRFSSKELEDIVKKISQEKYFFLIPKNSLIFFPTKKLEIILNQDRRVEEFTIRKIAPDILKINLKVFEPQAILLDFDQEYYLINKNGDKIIKIKSSAPLDSFPLIENKIEQRKNFISIIKFIKATAESFDFRIVKIEIYQDRGVETIKAITSENWDIYFDEKEEVEKRISNLFLVLREKIKDRKNLSYIDLRFENKVFYK